MTAARTLLSLVKFEHTIFALPFAYAGMLLAAATPASTSSLLPSRWDLLKQTLDVPTVLWITIAMVGARTLAMALNRLIDAGIDAANPRTAIREIPSGKVSKAQVWALCAVSLGLLILATTQLDPVTQWLWPIPVALFVIYPYTKRFTWLCHFFLGASIGLAAPAAWIAVTGDAPLAAWLLMGAIGLWIGGFDVIYATMDVDIDREQGLNSLPSRFGIGRALWVTRLCHIGTVALLAWVGINTDLAVGYWAALAIVAALLAWENSIVSGNDLSRVNAAFFTINGIVGVVFLAGVALGLV